MERWDKDTYDAIIWVRNNRNLFKMEVFETPYMRLSVKRKEYANAVEACFNGNQLKVNPLSSLRQMNDWLTSGVRHLSPSAKRMSIR
jgi:hypothetical protein